ncbi:unnamed protein product [Prunus armeniaca]
MDEQNNLMRQLLNQISLAQNLGLGQQGEEKRTNEHANRQFDGNQVGRAGVSRQGDAQQCDQLADMSQASRNIHERLGPQGGQLDNPHNEDHEERRSATRSRRANSRRRVTENPSQVQSTNTPPRQRSRESQPLQTNEEVTQSRPNCKGRQRDRPAMCAEDVEKLVNNRL